MCQRWCQPAHWYPLCLPANPLCLQSSPTGSCSLVPPQLVAFLERPSIGGPVPVPAGLPQPPPSLKTRILDPPAMDGPLELDESQLFGEEEEEEDEKPVDMSVHCSMALQSTHAAAAEALSATDSDSDDDGIVLESECSSSGAGVAGCRLQPGGRPSASQGKLLCAGARSARQTAAVGCAAHRGRCCNHPAGADWCCLLPACCAAAEDEVEADLVERLRSLQSSLDNAAAPLSEGEWACAGYWCKLVWEASC